MEIVSIYFPFFHCGAVVLGISYFYLIYYLSIDKRYDRVSEIARVGVEKVRIIFFIISSDDPRFLLEERYRLLG